MTSQFVSFGSPYASKGIFYRFWLFFQAVAQGFRILEAGMVGTDVRC